MANPFQIEVCHMSRQKLRHDVNGQGNDLRFLMLGPSLFRQLIQINLQKHLDFTSVA